MCWYLYRFGNHIYITLKLIWKVLGLFVYVHPEYRFYKLVFDYSLSYISMIVLTSLFVFLKKNLYPPENITFSRTKLIIYFVYFLNLSQSSYERQIRRSTNLCKSRKSERGPCTTLHRKTAILTFSSISFNGKFLS